MNRIENIEDEICAAVGKIAAKHDLYLQELTGTIKERDATIGRLEANAAELREALGDKDKHTQTLSDAIREREATIAQKETHLAQLRTDWDTASAKAQQEAQDVIGGLEADLIQIKGQYDAYIAKTSKEIEQLRTEFKALQEESDQDIALWKREKQRVEEDRKADGGVYAESIQTSANTIAALSLECEGLKKGVDARVAQLEHTLEKVNMAHGLEIEKLSFEREELRKQYQDERKERQAILEALGYSESLAPKSIVELIQDKDMALTRALKTKEEMLYEHSDKVAVLQSELEHAKGRIETQNETIARYRGIRDQGPLLVRMADCMRREQYSGSRPDVSELIAEAEKAALSVK